MIQEILKQESVALPVKKTTIKLLTGNLLDAWANGEVQYAGHGANCFGTMGAGIAGQIAQRFPEIYEADKEAFRDGRALLGSCSVYQHPGSEQMFFNMYTQYNPGPDASIEAIVSALKAARFLIHAYGSDPDGAIAIPQIGCGIGGLTWAKVEAALLAAEGIGDLIVYVYKPATVNFTRHPD